VPRVSVILNCFNQADYVDDAVASVLAQTYADLELLAVDNGSTDGTAQRLSRHADDPHVRLFLHGDNVSISRRFNEAVAASRGEFVSFLYSDDRLLPHKLERQLARFDALPADIGVVYGPALGENAATGEQWTYGSVGMSGDVFADLMLRHTRGQIDMVTPLIRRTALLEHPFDEEVFAEGEAIFLRIALTHQFSYIDEPLVVLRDHGSNAGKAIVRNAEMNARALDLVRAHPALRPEQRPLVDRYQARLLSNYGWQGARLGADRRWIRRCLRSALRLAPLRAVDARFVGAAVLSSLPSALTVAANRLGHRLRPHPGQRTLVAEYEGLAERPSP